MIKTFNYSEEDFLDSAIDKRNKVVEYLGNNEYRIKKILKRGDIVIIDFGIGIGREKSGLRPAIVVSKTEVNELRETVTVAPVTSLKNKFKSYDSTYVELFPSQFVLSKKFYTQLSSTSVVETENLRTLSKNRVGGFLGELSERSIDELDKCLLYSVGV